MVWQTLHQIYMWSSSKCPLMETNCCQQMSQHNWTHIARAITSHNRTPTPVELGVDMQSESVTSTVFQIISCEYPSRQESHLFCITFSRNTCPLDYKLVLKAEQYTKRTVLIWCPGLILRAHPPWINAIVTPMKKNIFPCSMLEEKAKKHRNTFNESSIHKAL